MGYANCGEDSQGRPIGYAHLAKCDKVGCEAEIDRGMGYACGGEHGAGEFYCEGYFCPKHKTFTGPEDLHGTLCDACAVDYTNFLVGEERDKYKRALQRISLLDDNGTTTKTARDIADRALEEK